MRLSRRALARGTKWAAFAVALVLAVTLAATSGGDTLSALGRTRPAFLLLALALYLLYLVSDGVRVVLLARALGHRLSLVGAVETVSSGIFLAVVTPLQLSGFPYMLWVLSERGVPGGAGSTLILARGLLIYGLLLGLAPFAVLRLGVGAGSLLSALVTYLAVVLFVVALGAVTVVLRPDVLSRVWPLSRFPTLTSGIAREAARARASALELLRARRKGPLAGALVLSLVSQFAYTSMVPALLLSLGVSFSLVDAFLAQALLQGALLFSLTPGNIGVGEAAGAALFYGACPKPLLGVFLVLWRTFTSLLTAFVGAAFVLRRLGLPYDEG